MKKLIYIIIVTLFGINLVSCSEAKEEHICETKTLGIVTIKDGLINNSKIKDIYVYYYPGDEGCHNGEYEPPPANYAGRITLTNNPDERYGWVDAIENVMCFYK